MREKKWYNLNSPMSRAGRPWKSKGITRKMLNFLDQTPLPGCMIMGSVAGNLTYVAIVLLKRWLMGD